MTGHNTLSIELIKPTREQARASHVTVSKVIVNWCPVEYLFFLFLTRLFTVPYFFVRSSRSKTLICVKGGHLGFICTEGEGVGVYRGGGREALSCLLSNRVPAPK